MVVPDELKAAEMRILVLAPLGRDASLSCTMLEQAGFGCRVCHTIDDLCDQLGLGAAAVLITEEAFAEKESRKKLLGILEAQPTWSDLPLTLLVRRRDPVSRQLSPFQSLLPSHNVTILERPVPVSTLTSVMQAALRARRRQYEVRDHLRWQARHSAELEAIIQSIPDGILVGTHRSIALANNQALHILGYDSLAELNKDLRDWGAFRAKLRLRDAHGGAPARREDVIALTDEAKGNQEFSIRRTDDERERVLRIATAPVRRPEGAGRVVIVVSDVTETRHAEDALRESEARFRTSVESMLDSFGIYSAVRDYEGQIVDFRIEYVNEAACRSNRLPREEQVGHRLLAVFPAHRTIGLFGEYCRVVESGEPLMKESLMYAVQSVDGERRLRAYDIRAAKLGDGFVATWRDVTARREAEDALERAREELAERVETRTAELTYTNAILQEQIEVRERAETQLRRRNKELTTLNMITAAASSSLQLPDVLSTLRDILSEELRIAGGIVFFYDEEREELELHYSWGLPEEIGGWDTPFAIRGTHFERVVQQKNSVYHPDVREISLYSSWHLDETRPYWRSYLCVPLVARGMIQGAFSLFSKRPAFNGEQRAFYVTLGQQIGVAINNARLYAEVLNRGERLQQLAQRVISVQEEERHRVSSELHDEAGQALTALMLSLEMTKSTLPSTMESVRESIEEAVELTGETMEHIRLLAHDLRTPSLDTIGLGPTLEGLCSDFGSRSLLEISYHGVELPDLPGMAAISLYRVAQEALTNVVRHSGASAVEVILSQENGEVMLTVADNGVGFDPQAAFYQASDGIGLPGLRERMETLGGRLEVRSAPGEGTRVIAHVPLTDSAVEVSLP